MTGISVSMRGARRLVFVLLASGGVACGDNPLAPDVATTGAPSDPAGLSAEPLPWQISATVATTPAQPPPGCAAYLTSVIEGTATHAGRFAGVGSTCILSPPVPDPDPPFLPAGPPPYVTIPFTNPRWTLTTANGDEIWIEAIQALAVISLTDGSLAAKGTQRIIGGTGRFAAATGEADVGAVNDDGQGPDDFSGHGWIRFR